MTEMMYCVNKLHKFNRKLPEKKCFKPMNNPSESIFNLRESKDRRRFLDIRG